MCMYQAVNEKDKIIKKSLQIKVEDHTSLCYSGMTTLWAEMLGLQKPFETYPQRMPGIFSFP